MAPTFCEKPISVCVMRRTHESGDCQIAINFSSRDSYSVAVEPWEIAFDLETGTGSAKLTEKDGEDVLVAGTDYDVTCPDGCKDVGTHTVMVTCTGSVTFLAVTTPLLLTVATAVFDDAHFALVGVSPDAVSFLVRSVALFA